MQYEDSLQTAMKRREVKGKGEKERYTHLNAQFQKIAMRDKKAFLNDQCKEIEESNRMGNTRETYMQVRKQQLELDIEQQSGSKQEKYYINTFVYCHPAYLTSMQSTS